MKIYPVTLIKDKIKHDKVRKEGDNWPDRVRRRAQVVLKKRWASR